jgi:hypothetical protein
MRLNTLADLIGILRKIYPSSKPVGAGPSVSAYGNRNY